MGSGASATAFGTGLAGAGDSQANFLVPGRVRLGVGRMEVGGVVVETKVRSASQGLFFRNTKGLAQFGTGMRYRPDVERFVGGLAVRVVVDVVGAGWSGFVLCCRRG